MPGSSGCFSAEWIVCSPSFPDFRQELRIEIQVSERAHAEQLQAFQQQGNEDLERNDVATDETGMQRSDGIAAPIDPESLEAALLQVRKSQRDSQE